MGKNKPLEVRILENISAAALELNIETFLREHTNIDVTNIAYAIQKKEETELLGCYSCILIYIQR